MILKWLGALLFFLMMATPFEFYAIKIFIMIVLVSYRLYVIVRKRKLDLSRSVFFWFIIFILFGLLFSLWSLMFSFSNIEFVLKILPVYFVWPLFYMLLVPYLLNLSIVGMLNKMMVYASIFISSYLTLSFLSVIGLLPIPFELFSLAKPILGRSESVEVQLFMPAVTSLLFLNPFLFSSLLLGVYKKYNISQGLMLFAFFVTTVAVIVTGRRSLMLNVLLAPIILLILLKLSKIKLDVKTKKALKKFIVSLVFGGIILYGYLVYSGLVDLGVFWDFFISGFDFSSDGKDAASSGIRGEQFTAMIQSWLDYPILGTGLASPSEYVIRSEETPWMYELSYLAWLFQTGIIGFTVIMSLFAWLFVKGISVIRKNNKFSYMLPIFVGCFTFLVGCASNPYLQAFDHMWAVFLPVGLINYCNKNQNI